MKASKTEIDSAILKAYGSYDNPDLSFINKAFTKKPYQELIEKLSDQYSIKDYTDLNYDRSFDYDLSKGDHGYGLKLSMVGKFALLFKLNEHNKWDVLTEGRKEASDIISILKSMILKL